MTNCWRSIDRKSLHPLRHRRLPIHQSSAIFPMDTRTLPSASRQTESWTVKKGKPESFIFELLNWFQISSNFPPRQSRRLCDLTKHSAWRWLLSVPRAHRRMKNRNFFCHRFQKKTLARRRISARRFRYTITQMGWKLFFVLLYWRQQ